MSGRVGEWGSGRRRCPAGSGRHRASSFRCLSGLGLALGLGLAGCRTGRENGREITLHFWGLGREGEVVAQLAPQFERENPGIRVQVQQIPWTAAHEKLLTAYVGDATPDLAQIGNTWVSEFAALGAVRPLTRLAASSPVANENAFFAGAWRGNVVNGVAYGLPWYVDTRVIFYRPDLLKQAGYDSVPATWSGWLEAMQRLKQVVGPRNYAILLPTTEWAPPVSLALATGSTLLKDGGRYGAFEEPAFRRAYDFYIDIFRRGLAPPVASSAVSNVYQEFARGSFAMYITGPWQLGEFAHRLPPGTPWATAPMPGPDGEGSRISMAGGSSLVIFRSTAHEAEAWRFLEYLSRPDVQLRFYGLTGDLPAVTAAWRDTSLIGNRYARAFWEQLQRMEPLPAVPEIEDICIRVQDATESVVRGGTSVDAALARLDKQVNDILAKRRWLLAQDSIRRAGAAGKGGR
ncbi:MAG TPA: sugar ABC transporter substrate-binding protein [Longimicrobiales bacterium]